MAVVKIEKTRAEVVAALKESALTGGYLDAYAEAMGVEFAPPPVTFADLAEGERYTDASGIHCVKSEGGGVYHPDELPLATCRAERRPVTRGWR